jgi:large subunit ribosomal protein L21
MEAVINCSGRQFRVKEGMTIEVDYQKVEPGSTIEFSDVRYVGGTDGEPRIGSPSLAGAKVIAKVVGMVKGPKLIVANFRRRKNSRRRVGHRQKYMKVRIESIQG